MTTAAANDGRAARLISRHRDALEHSARRPLLERMAGGTVTAQEFAAYLRIEGRFVRTAARVLGYCVWQSPTWEALVEHTHALYGLVTEQSDYFAARAGTSDELPEGHDALDDVVLRAVQDGYPAVITCFAAAETLYLQWCRTAEGNAGGPVHGIAAQWISLHTTPEFQRGVDALQSLLDAVDPGVFDEAQLDHWFRQMLTAEDRFHDAPTRETTSR